jgi:hypothetical protein
LGALFSSVLLAVSSPAWAQEAAGEQSTLEAIPAKPRAATEPARGRPADKPYFIEFRARNADSYGHTFSIYGHVNANGKIANFTVAGLHPFTESPVPWMVGHLVVVPSETGASDGDTDDQYVLARFHVALSADEYKKVIGYIKQLQAKSPMWHAVLYNCNAFVGDIAKFMGMNTPASTLLMPADYINNLRKLNMTKTGIVGTPVVVASPEQLRQAALKAIAAHGKKAGAGPEGVAKKTEHASAKKEQSSLNSPTPKSIETDRTAVY